MKAKEKEHIRKSKNDFTNIGKVIPTDTQTNTDDDFWGIEPTETKIEPITKKNTI